ncbi:amidohydrolase family protein [Actinomadura harenae]|uniref:amidohydrolase family protein n=1 Tax=Actinomadura harenae TaxID=2483351 RepID=UPI0018F7151D|nr:amidohydrolase family protein [Actinomadura harenae]
MRIFDGRVILDASCARIAGGRVDALGGSEIVREGDELVAGRGGTLLPGLIDAHVHLLPGCTQLAALFGVTTVIDQFSKPEVIERERAAADASEPVCADMRTSGIGATAPGGHPTLAYAPIPYVHGPADAAEFVNARAHEGATHLKLIYDDGSGAHMRIPTLDTTTVEALVREAHKLGMPVVAHVSTAVGAVTMARCGVDVLAHAPFDSLSDGQVTAVASAGCAVIATLDVVDGFPGPDGRLPLQHEPNLPARWRRVLDRQSRRWMPPQRPDGAAARRNAPALREAGAPVLAGTDAPNPGLVCGASLHRELRHLVAAGFRPEDALTAATDAPARVFGLTDRGRVEVGRRADLVLVDGDPTVSVEASRNVRATWVTGRRVAPGAYPGSQAERDGIAHLRATTEKIVEALRERRPGFPAPETVTREDGEPLGRIVPSAGGWQAMTIFGAPLGETSDREAAREILQVNGLSSLAEPWWARPMDEPSWREARLLEVRPDRVRVRWTDPLAEQPASGRWFELDDIDLARTRPEDTTPRA